MVLEDAVALLGILLTLIVAGVSFIWGPRPVFDAIVAIVVALLLGTMALFLAAINRRLLIDASDPDLDAAANRFLASKGIAADVSSILLDDDRGVVFVRTRVDGGRIVDADNSFALGEALKAYARTTADKTVDEVFWKFPTLTK